MTTEIKYRLSSSSEWKTFQLNAENNEEQNNQNKIMLKDVILSSMQTQHIMVLAGSGTSLGHVGGPSMWKLWVRCTNNEQVFMVKDQDSYNSDANKPDGVYKVTTKSGVEYFQILKSQENQLSLKIDKTEILSNKESYFYDDLEVIFDNLKINYSDIANKVFKDTNYPIEDNNKLNIEELLSWCEAFLQINQNPDVKGFVDSCKKYILDECSTFLKVSSQLDGHKTFVHKLSKRRSRDPRLKIFTTNYDTCFEEAASNQGIVVIDGFSFTKPRYYDPRFFDYDIIRRSSDNNQSDSFVEGVFQIYKLHGSVNWKRDSNYNFIVEDIPQPESACMIFPAKGKYQQSYIQPHLELMARYLSCLRSPNTCILITGFGFNDDHLSEPIVSAIKSNPNLKVIIADYKAEESINNQSGKYSKYWNTLAQLSRNGYDITFINASFQDFATLIPDLGSLSPADKLMQDIKNIVGEVSK